MKNTEEPLLVSFFAMFCIILFVIIVLTLLYFTSQNKRIYE